MDRITQVLSVTNGVEGCAPSEGRVGSRGLGYVTRQNDRARIVQHDRQGNLDEL